MNTPPAIAIPDVFGHVAADVREQAPYRNVFRHMAADSPDHAPDDPPYPRQIVRYGGWF